MGDVFKAMNRARQERGEPQDDDQTLNAGAPTITQAKSDQRPQTPRDQAPADVSEAEVPGLPINQIDVRSLTEDENAPADDNRLSTITQDTDTIETGLNGYAESIVVHHDRGSIITEQFRAIRTQILARNRNRRLQSHVITSAAPGEGKSVTTINMGICFTELKNQKTLLLEADLRRPSFDTLFDRDCQPGLSHYLNGQVDNVDEVLYPTVYDNLQFLPAGEIEAGKSTELLSSPRFVQILDRLKDRYDHIFIDSPPVISVTDACILGAMCDQTLLVVRLNKTAAELIERTQRLLRASNCELAGVIITHLQHERVSHKVGRNR